MTCTVVQINVTKIFVTGTRIAKEFFFNCGRGGNRTDYSEWSDCQNSALDHSATLPTCHVTALTYNMLI